MKINDGCALQKLVDGYWMPLAIRYQQLNVTESRLLAQGEIIIRNTVPIRRYDWRERQALARVFKE